MNTQLGGILLLTFRELWARKVIVALFALGTLAWLLLALALQPEATSLPPALADEFGAEGPPRALVMEQFMDQNGALVAGAAYWMTTLLALFAAAPLFAEMLERGRIELLLSKPIRRTHLLAGHVAGVLLMVLLLAAYFLGTTWLVLSLKTGLWEPRFLLAIPVLVAMFGVLYAVVLLVGIWTESTALSLIAPYGLIFLSLLLAQHERIVPALEGAGRSVFLGLYYVLPNFAEATGLVQRLAGGEAVASWMPLTSSLLFGAACYGAATLWFTRRDF